MQMQKKILLLGLGLLLGFMASCGSKATNPDHAGIEIGNPSVTVSAEFNLATGLPSYAPSSGSALIAIAPSQLTWSDLRLPLSQVRYFASYYYYMPTDPLLGQVLWPEDGVDTLRAMDVLAGDTLVANFANMNIPSRSYLKEVGLEFDFSKWQIHGTYCASATSCQRIELDFDDSTYLEVRYHHDQLINIGGDTGHVALPVHFHSDVLLSSLNLSGTNTTITPDSVIHVRVDSSLLANIAKSFNALRYRTMFKSKGYSEFSLTPAAESEYDSVGVDRVQNGDFSQHGNSWVFLTQLNGAADTSFASGGVVVDIVYGSHVDYSVQWMQEDIPLVQGRWYKFTFTAHADRDSTLLLSRIGRYYAPYDNLDQGNQDNLSPLTTVDKVYSYEFCAKETNPFGRLEFNLGNYSRKVTLSNVSLVQLAF